MAWKVLTEDWSNRDVRDAIMRKYGKRTEPYYSRNENHELVRVEVSPDKVVIETKQKNGFIRENRYRYGEDLMEEIFKGKWY